MSDQNVSKLIPTEQVCFNDLTDQGEAPGRSRGMSPRPTPRAQGRPHDRRSGQRV